MMKCKKCYTPLRMDWKICPYCNEPTNSIIIIDYITLPIDILRENLKAYGIKIRIFIYFIVFCIMISTFKMIFNETTSIALSCILVLIYISIKFYRPIIISKLKEKHQQEILLLKESVSSSISTCVLAYTKDWGLWPDEVTIPNYDFLPIQHIVESDTGKLVSLPLLKQFTKETLEEQAYNRFRDSFIKIVEIDKQLEFTPLKATNVYLEIFLNKNQYIPYLYAMLQNYNFNAITMQFLENDIHEKYRLKSIAARANDIRSAINGEGSISNVYTLADIDVLDGIEFEHFLQKLFEKMGYEAKVTSASGDQGADLLLEKYGRRIIVQAKRYSNNVANSAIQEAVAAKAYYHYDSAMVVTNSLFTRSAIELATANNVELIDRNKLASLINNHPIGK